MASEAVHDYRAHSRSPAAQLRSPNISASSSGSSREITSPDNNTSLDEDDKHYKMTAYEVTFEDGTSSSEDDGDDEAAWKLDEMVEQQLASSSRADPVPKASATADSVELDISAAKPKKQDDAIHDLVRMAGPPPRPAHRLPCPVIIPQRRPGNRSRGFVRAYAPVMEMCGVGQDVFFQFQDDWVTASKVCIRKS